MLLQEIVMEETEELNVEEEYDKIATEKSLPKFEEILQDFDLDKIAIKDAKIVLREIRKSITEKISAYLHLFESLMNPSSTPVFIFSAMKKQGKERNKEIQEIYKELSKIQLKTILLDTVSDEEEEAHFIRHTFDKWQNLKVRIHDIFSTLEGNLDREDISKSSGYLG